MSFEAAYGSSEREKYRVARLEDDNDRLKAENAKLRAALEAAPNPETHKVYGKVYPVDGYYAIWFDGPRAEALKS